MMPVPRALSAACGICVAFDQDDSAAIQASMPEDIEGLYHYADNKFSTIFEIEEE